jgi:hypothetical protein
MISKRPPNQWIGWTEKSYRRYTQSSREMGDTSIMPNEEGRDSQLPGQFQNWQIRSNL